MIVKQIAHIAAKQDCTVQMGIVLLVIMQPHIIYSLPRTYLWWSMADPYRFELEGNHAVRKSEIKTDVIYCTRSKLCQSKSYLFSPMCVSSRSLSALLVPGRTSWSAMYFPNSTSLAKVAKVVFTLPLWKKRTEAVSFPGLIWLSYYCPLRTFWRSSH